MRPSRLSAIGVLAAAIAAFVAACTVGPDYHPPKIATPSTYAGLGDAKADPLSHPVAGDADLSRWWTQFHDPTLDWLIDQALSENLSLREASARLRQSREQEAVAGAAGLPHATASATVARLNANSRSLLIPDLFGGESYTGTGDTFHTPSHLNLFAANFDASWEVDIFGGVRRSVQEARANTEAAVWQKRDGEVSLTAEVASDYVMLRALQAEIAIARSEAQAQAANFTIVKQQAQTGFVTRLNINQQDAQVEATIAAIPELQAEAAAQVHALGVLLGRQPDALTARLAAPGPLPAAPAVLPVGLPSELLRRRPDVRRAERQLAADTAGIGVQVANLYPKFNIMAIAPAFASTTTAHLFDADNAVSVGYGMISWPVFQGGRVRANIRAARAQADQAYLIYQATVLVAVQNVEDALARYRSDQERIIALRRAVSSAANSQVIAQQQFKVGLVTFINVLQAQNTLLNARNNLTQANAQLARDLASLYTALGGGWTADEAKAQTPAGVSWP